MARSWLLHAEVIQERLGHAPIKTTLDTYGHLFEGLDEAAAVRLNETWRGLSSLGTRVPDGFRYMGDTQYAG